MNKKITLLLPILLLLGACSQSQQTETQPTGATPIKCQWSDTSLKDLYCNSMPPEEKGYFVSRMSNNDEYNHYQGSVPSVDARPGFCTIYRIEQQEKIDHDLVGGGEFNIYDSNSQGYNPYVYYLCKEDFEAIQPSLRKAEDVYDTIGEVVFPKKLGNTLHILLLENSQYLSSSYLQTVHFKLREAVKTIPPTKE